MIPEMKPLVSILIPAYNAERWLPYTLYSALAQTWPNKEIIVVDDGSKDRTLEVARQFKSDRVRVVTHANQGAAATRNTAYQMCHGDYIQWLDADDLLSPDKIALQMERAEQLGNERLLLSCGWSSFLHRYYQAKFVPTPLWCDLSPTDWLIRKMSLNLHMQTATWLVSRNLTEAVGPWNTTLAVDDDGEYFCRVLLASDQVCFVPGAKVYYRDSGAESLSYIGTSSKKLDAQWQSMQQHIRCLRSLEDSDQARAACVDYMQNWLHFFYPGRPDLVAQMHSLAQDLCGSLRIPGLPWKYSWIAPLLGYQAARRAQFILPRVKWSLLRACDGVLFRMAGHGSLPPHAR